MEEPNFKASTISTSTWIGSFEDDLQTALDPRINGAMRMATKMQHWKL